jgi:hypothetical protein
MRVENNWNHVTRIHLPEKVSQFLAPLTELSATIMISSFGTQLPISLILDHSPDDHSPVA